jgi:hypothetical protein
MTIENKMQRVRNLIMIEAGIDVAERSRERDTVEMRAVYYKILKEVHHLSLTRIARSLGYNHATVIHALNNFENWSTYNNNLVMCYNSVRETIMNGGDHDSVYDDVMAMRRRIEILEQSNQDLRIIINKNLKGKRGEIHSMIMGIPEEKIYKATKRMDALITCL